ncbi:MAG TPA: histidine kinase [Gemmatimonadaceae bacterium]|jgi:signal transduction histidine kinase
MNARDLTALVHLVGFTTGIVLYAMLGMMTRRRPSYVVTPSREQTPDRVPLFAALLGVAWNVGAMLMFSSRDFGLPLPLRWVAAIAYTALGFLPAVVVHSTLLRSKRTGYRWFVGVAYAGSSAAGLLHVLAAARGDTGAPSSIGLLLLTITYAGLLGILIITERGRPGFQRSITAVALAAFAVSALHLSRHAGLADQDPWPVELIGHHASLPLVLAILYQDYRFAFADLFLKRALSLLALAGLVALLYAGLAAPLVDPHAIAARRALNDGTHLFVTEALLALWIATALVYPFIQRRMFRFVDRVVLRRADYRELRAELGRRLTAARDVDGALDVTSTLLARALGASTATWHPMRSEGVRGGGPTIALDARRSEASIAIPTAIAPSYEIVVDASSGGRTLLSDDLMLIDAVAASVGRRIDELRLENERVEREQQEQEMRRLATEAELRALRAQLNPHFLFNALNTLGSLMQSAPDRALTTLYRLTGLLRAVLRRTNGEFVALREELEIVELYLAIERERFQERLIVSIDVPADLLDSRVPPLILQPLVENAVKHGIAPLRDGGTVTVRATNDVRSGDADGCLRLAVIDTGSGHAADGARARTGVGLSNIQVRLRHYFGPRATLTVGETPGGGTTVEMCLPRITRDAAAEPRALASITR